MQHVELSNALVPGWSYQHNTRHLPCHSTYNQGVFTEVNAWWYNYWRHRELSIQMAREADTDKE